MIADIPGYLAKQVHVSGNDSFLSVIPQKVTKDPAEVFMTWEGEKTP